MGSEGKAAQAACASALPGQELGKLVRRRYRKFEPVRGAIAWPATPPDNTLIEMVFEMPEEISGQKNSTVLCQGRVIRSKDGQNGAESVALAASILDYKFLRQN